MMRSVSILSALMLLGVLGAGCTKIRSCKAGTALLTIDYQGDAATANQLQLDITVNGGAAQTTTLSHSPGAATGTVEVDFSGAYPASATMDVVATALNNGTVVGTTTESIPVAAGCTAAQLTVGSFVTSDDMAGGGSDGGATPDMAPHVPSISLYAALNYATGKNPFGSVASDFNRDGKLDFAVANFGSNSISVAIGNGQGGFAPPTSIDVTSSPTGIVTADFDGKNGPDVAVLTGPAGASSASGAVHILLNDGTGKLVLAATSYAVGTGQGFIQTADFNHDAKPDIVVVNYGSNNSNMGVVNILLNRADGSGGMLGPQSITTSSDASALAVADFDGVSGPDIAVYDIHGAAQTADIRILLNNGSGGFSTTTVKGPFTITPGRSFNLVAADFDGKNGPDLVLTNGNIMLNDGTGTLGALTALTGFPSRCDAALAIDFDKDTHPDLFCSGFQGVNVLINKADGSGTFNAPASSVAATANSVSLGDFNGDGKLDAIVGNGDTSNAAIMLNDGSGKNTFIAARGATLGRATIAIEAADFNSDTHMDLISASETSGNVSLSLGDGKGALAAAIDFPTGLSGAAGLAVGDLNTDKKPDVVVVNPVASGGVRVLFNSGGGALAAPVPYTVGPTSGGVVLADLDGKNGFDIAVADTAGKVYVLINDGAGTFSAAGPYTTGAGAASIVAADFNQDGAIDLATANQSANTVSVLLNDGTGAFATAMTASYPSGTFAIGLTAGDIDGDAVADLVIANFQDATLTVYRNKADHTGAMVKLPDLSTDLNPRSVRVVDINMDGKAEIVASAQNGYALDVFPNLGSSSFGAAIGYCTSATPTAIGLGDLNGDGLVDVVVGTAYTVSDVLLNTSH